MAIRFYSAEGLFELKQKNKWAGDKRAGEEWSVNDWDDQYQIIVIIDNDKTKTMIMGVDG